MADEGGSCADKSAAGWGSIASASGSHAEAGVGRAAPGNGPDREVRRSLRQQPTGHRDGQPVVASVTTCPGPAGLSTQPQHLSQHGIEALTPDVLHRVVMRPLVLAHEEDRDDVGVVQERGGLRLALEPDQLHAIHPPVGRQHLQGHPPAEALLHGLVDDPHAATAELADDPIVAQPFGHRLASSRTLGGADRMRVRLAVHGLHHHERGEQLADLVGELGMEPRVFLRRGALAAAITLGELVGQLVEDVLPRRRLDHDQGSSQSLPSPLKISLSRLSAGRSASPRPSP